MVSRPCLLAWLWQSRGVYPNTCWCSKFDCSDGSNGDVDVVAGFPTEGQTRSTDEILDGNDKELPYGYLILFI